jgi:hypothetical protein
MLSLYLNQRVDGTFLPLRLFVARTFHDRAAIGNFPELAGISFSRRVPLMSEILPSRDADNASHERLMHAYAS